MFRKIPKGLSIILILTMIISMFMSNALIIVDAYTMENAPVLVERKIDSTNLEVGDEFMIRYKVLPQRIPAEMINENVVATDKEVFIIMDKSNSMWEKVTSGGVTKTRNEFAIDSANAFLDRLKLQSNIKVGVVVYGEDTDILKLNGKKFHDISERESEIREFFEHDHMGGTNIGEAIRVAARNLERFGGKDAKKHIVLLTDGEPTAYSFNKMSYKTGDYDDSLGYQVAGNKRKFVSKISSMELKGYKANGDHAEKYFVNWGGNDYNGYAQTYAKLMSEQAGEVEGLKSHLISFTYDSDSKTKLNEVAAQQPNATVYATNDSIQLDAYYDEIADEIITDFVLEDVYFQDLIPDGLEVTSAPDYVEIDPGMVSGSLESIKYALNEEGTYYEPENSIEFFITAKVTEGKTVFSFPESDQAFVRYRDMDGSITYKYFNGDDVLGSVPFDVTPYVNDIIITPSDTELYQEEQVEISYALEPSDLEATFEDGEEVIESIAVEDIFFKHLVPENLVPVIHLLPEGFAFDEETRLLTGSFSGLSIDLQESGYYQLASTPVVITYTFETAKDIDFPTDSVELDYINLLGEAVEILGGNDFSINILPTIPVIDPVSGDDVIDYDEVENVVITGEASANTRVYVTFRDPSNNVLNAGYDGDPETLDDTEALTDNDGDYSAPATNIKSLDTGDVVVEARVIDEDGDVSTASRDITAKTRVDLIDEITITANPNNVVVGDLVNLEFEFEGSQVELDGTWTGDSYQLTNVVLAFEMPDNMTLSDGLWSTADVYEGGSLVTKAVSPAMTLTIERRPNGRYQLVDDSISVAFVTTTTRNISIPENSVKVTYNTSNDPYSYGFNGGDSESIVVRPMAPSLNKVNGSDKVFSLMLTEVKVSGEVSANPDTLPVVTVDLKITDSDKNEKEANNLDVEDDGTFEVLMDWTGFIEGDVEIEATSTDDEGDTNTSTYDETDIFGPDELPDNI